MARDWSVMADGPSLTSPDTWLRWDGTRAAGHLYAVATHGYMNYRRPTFIRGHGDSEPRRAAAQGPGTVMTLLPVKAAAAVEAESLVAAAGERNVARPQADSTACVSLGEVQLRIQLSGQIVAVDDTGRLYASSRTTCEDGEPECTFDRFLVPQVKDALFALRSRMTGHFVRFEGFYRPAGVPITHLGAKPPFARPKVSRPLLSSAHQLSRCPLQARQPNGWGYNASIYEPLIRRSLMPWHEGNVSATMLDFGFDRAMFGTQARRDGKPASHHVSIVDGKTRLKSNNDYRKSMLVDMLHTVCGLVAMPDVEFLISLWDHPKVPQQNAEPVVRQQDFNLTPSHRAGRLSERSGSIVRSLQCT